MKQITVGLVGCSQLSFPGDVRGQFARSAGELEALSRQQGFHLWVYPDSVITEEDARTARAAAEAAGVDFLMLQCTSFSAGAVLTAMVRDARMRIGLWAIPEGTKSGPVPFNSLCGINMFSAIAGHYLKEDIPLKWFYGNAGDPLFTRRFALTVRVLAALKNMAQSTVALVGGIAPGFDDLYFDERLLMERFEGLQVRRLHEFSEIADRARSYREKEIHSLLEEQQKQIPCAHPTAVRMLETNARVYRAFKDFLGEHGYEALAVSCWPKFQQAFAEPFSVCDVVARLNDDGIVTACEGDLPSAVSMLLLHSLGGDETMLMDLSAFDETDDTVLFWHCGPAAKRFAAKNGYTLGVNYSGTPHPGETLANASGTGVAREMVFDGGHATVARLTGDFDSFFLCDGDFSGDGKPSWHGSRGWMGNLRLNREALSARDFINTVLVRRFPHHFPVAPGDLTQEILETAAWLNMGRVEKAPYQDYLQRWNGL